MRRRRRLRRCRAHLGGLASGEIEIQICGATVGESIRRYEDVREVVSQEKEEHKFAAGKIVNHVISALFWQPDPRSSAIRFHHKGGKYRIHRDDSTQ